MTKVRHAGKFFQASMAQIVFKFENEKNSLVCIAKILVISISKQKIIKNMSS